MAKGVEDYYVGSGESSGYWLASGIRELGIEGEVTASQLRTVLGGRDPATGESLLNAKSAAKGNRVPGFDLTFRAPKSVSLLYALGDGGTSNQVMSAHDAAVSAALGYLERHASDARRGRGGTRTIPSTGFICAAFRHRTSRAGDPLLHTHVLAANLIRGTDGRWGALDARQLYRHAKTAGYLYQAHLRAELTQRLGLAWTPVRNGCADIEGIPRTVIRAFSRRREEIKASMREAGVWDAHAAEVVAMATRKAKDYAVSPRSLMPRWRAQADALGLDARALAALGNRASWRAPSQVDARFIMDGLASAEGLTRHASSFTRKEVLQEICTRLATGAPVSDVEVMADAFLASGRVVRLSPTADQPAVSESREPTVGAREPSFSTPQMLDVERALLELAAAPASAARGVANRVAVQAAIQERPTLSDEQAGMVRRLVTSGRPVDVVVGKAGTGKTFALDAARDAWQRSGLRVIGCSLSARAAEELQTGSGIASHTIAALLRDLVDPIMGRFAPGSVLVVDEAGMVGTRDLERLLRHADASDTKVVLVGDHRQLPEIAAGGGFRAIEQLVGATELSEVRRQPYGWERAALEMIRSGDAAHAIAAYAEQDRVVVSASAEETRTRLLSDWWRSRTEGEPALMLAARRSDVADLNWRARSLMKVAGELGGVDMVVSDTAFSVGDRVMTLKNDRRLDVKNGTRGVVSEVDPASGELTMSRDDGSTVRLPAGYLARGHVTHAYAITGHKAQGMTTERALVLADQTLYREWAYVAMSRGRQENRLYVVAGIDGAREDLGGEIAPIEDPLQEVVEAVRRSRAKELALQAYDPGIDPSREGLELSLER